MYFIPKENISDIDFQPKADSTLVTAYFTAECSVPPVVHITMHIALAL